MPSTPSCSCKMPRPLNTLNNSSRINSTGLPSPESLLRRSCNKPARRLAISAPVLARPVPMNGRSTATLLWNRSCTAPSPRSTPSSTLVGSYSSCIKVLCPAAAKSKSGSFTTKAAGALSDAVPANWPISAANPLLPSSGLVPTCSWPILTSLPKIFAASGSVMSRAPITSITGAPLTQLTFKAAGSSATA